MTLGKEITPEEFIRNCEQQNLLIANTYEKNLESFKNSMTEIEKVVFKYNLAKEKYELTLRQIEQKIGIGHKILLEEINNGIGVPNEYSTNQIIYHFDRWKGYISKSLLNLYQNQTIIKSTLSKFKDVETEKKVIQNVYQ